MNATELTEAYNNNLRIMMNYYNYIINRIYNMRRLQYRIKNYYINLYKNYFYKRASVLNKEYYNKLVTLINPEEINININNNKKALLIGINYNGTNAQLNGCINDTNSIHSALLDKYKFKNEDIRIITDDTPEKPTRDTILASFKSLLENGKAGDLLFFSYSGHGSSTFDRNNDENDGKDEMIISSDLKGVLDDELKQLIQTYLKKDVTLFALFDCCFSGTVLDLKYQYLDSLDNNNFTQNNKEETTIGNVIMISGCNDDQTSADAYINNKYQGAMSWAFLSAVSSTTDQETLTWRDLLIKMRDQLKTSQYTQLPQLSSGCFIDINSKICI